MSSFSGTEKDHPILALLLADKQPPDIEEVRLVLETSGSIDAETIETALNFSCRRGYSRIADFLISLGAIPTEALLINAYRDKKYEIVALLTSKGLDPTYQLELLYRDNPALALQFMQDNAISPNVLFQRLSKQPAEYQESPAQVALLESLLNWPIIDLYHSYDEHSPSAGSILLDHACYRGHVPIVIKLLEKLKTSDEISIEQKKDIFTRAIQSALFLRKPYNDSVIDSGKRRERKALCVMQNKLKIEEIFPRILREIDLLGLSIPEISNVLRGLGVWSTDEKNLAHLLTKLESLVGIISDEVLTTVKQVLLASTRTSSRKEELSNVLIAAGANLNGAPLYEKDDSDSENEEGHAGVGNSNLLTSVTPSPSVPETLVPISAVEAGTPVTSSAAISIPFADAAIHGSTLTRPLFSTERERLIADCHSYVDVYKESSPGKKGILVIETLLTLLENHEITDAQLEPAIRQNSGLYSLFGNAARKRIIREAADLFLASLSKDHGPSPH